MTYDDVGYRLRRIQGLLEEILEVLTPDESTMTPGCNCDQYRTEGQWMCPVHELMFNTSEASDKTCV